MVFVLEKGSRYTDSEDTHIMKYNSMIASYITRAFQFHIAIRHTFEVKTQ